MIKVLSNSIRVLSTTAHQVKITIKTKKVEKHAELTFESVSTSYGFKHQGGNMGERSTYRGRRL